MMKNAIVVDTQKVDIKNHLKKFVDACKRYDAEYEIHVAVWETDMWNEYRAWDVTVDYYENDEHQESWTWKNLDSADMSEELDEKNHKALMKACQELGAYLGKHFNSSLGTVYTHCEIQHA